MYTYYRLRPPLQRREEDIRSFLGWHLCHGVRGFLLRLRGLVHTFGDLVHYGGGG